MNKVIAWELGLSIRTIEAYRAQMLTKLGVRGTAQALRVALAAGIAITEQSTPRLLDDDAANSAFESLAGRID